MLATLARTLPTGDYRYEPKWDGFRCVAFRDRHEIDLRSRNQRPLARYFPEVVEALSAVPTERFVLDGELVATAEADGRIDFGVLMLRLHPSASRVARLRQETPASFVAFDLLAMDDRDLRDLPFVERRDHLVDLLSSSTGASLLLTPSTDDPATAEGWFDDGEGVVAKAAHSRYESGRRSAGWVKVKRQRTADCVIAGYRWAVDAPVVASVLLGLYDGDVLRHIGVAASFPADTRRRLVQEFEPYITWLTGHPWERGFALEGGPMGRLKGSAGSWDPRTMVHDWVPLRPELVCEVAYDHVDRNGRWRHAGRFVRLRPDRDPRSCTVDQLQAA